MLSLQTDTVQIAKIKEKLEKYPPYVIGKGLDAVSGHLNQSSFKRSIYPLSQSGQPFAWSSDKQRRYVFANVDLPSVRTMELADAGEFKVEKRYSSFYIYYTNATSYAKWVIGNFTQIVGHRLRGWQSVNTQVVNKRSEVVQIFKDGTNGAWNELR